MAGFGKGGTSLPFWEDVYGFDMKFVGQEVVHDATQMPIIDVVDCKDVVTNSCLVQVSPHKHCLSALEFCSHPLLLLIRANSQEGKKRFGLVEVL